MRTSVLFRILVFLALAFPVLAVNAGAAVPWSEEDCNSFTFPSNPTQIDVLQKFYCDTGGPSWTNKNKWGAATLSNDWHGIFFDSGNVIDISLNGNQLTGTIPAELGSLTSLTALYLDQNQLSGTIPAESAIKSCSASRLRIRFSFVTKRSSMASSGRSRNTVNGSQNVGTMFM